MSGAVDHDLARRVACECGASVTMTQFGSSFDTLIFGDAGAVRRSAAVLGLSFGRVSPKVTRLTAPDGAFVTDLVSDGTRASFTLCSAPNPYR